MIIDFSNNGNGGGSYELPIASQSTLGGIKVGQNLSIDSAGTLSADAQAVGVATTATTGVVQVGSGLSITSGGVLSTDIDLSDYVQTSELDNYATKTDLEDYATKTDLSGYALESELGDYATIESLSGYVETSEMSGYVTTNTLSGYATTDSLSGYVETSAMSGYVETSALTDYATNESLSAYQTTQGMSGYVQTSAMSGYATTDSLSAYTPQSAMSDYLTTSEYRDDVDDVLEQNMKTLYGDDGAVGMAYLWNDGVSDKAKVFKVTASGTSVDDYTYVQPSKNTKAFVGWSMDKSEQIATIDEDNWDNPTIALKGGVAKFGYVDNHEGVANFLVSYDQQLWQQTFTREYDPKEGEVVWVDGGIQPIGGGEEIEKTNTTNWGTVQLGNGIGLEVHDNVIFGVSAGENYVFGNGEGVEYYPNNSRGGGMKSPLPSAYTQYDLDIYDDYDNCIALVDGGGNINLSLCIDGQDGNVVRFDCDGTRYIKIYCSSGVYYLEASADNPRGAKSLPTTATTIEFSTSSPYKDFMIHYDGSGNIEVYESYDNYNTPIAELSDVDFGETISHIQLFDSGTSMEVTGIGTISINNTDIIKPYYEYDGDTVTNVGFVLRKRSCYLNN